MLVLLITMILILSLLLSLSLCLLSLKFKSTGRPVAQIVRFRCFQRNMFTGDRRDPEGRVRQEAPRVQAPAGSMYVYIHI